MIPIAKPPTAVAAVPASTSVGQLAVGSNIRIRGAEIVGCDTLVVEGEVEASVDVRLLQISQSGVFRGAAELDEADIRGVFDGTLVVRKLLVVRATGVVTGQVTCLGALVVDGGGMIGGSFSGPQGA